MDYKELFEKYQALLVENNNLREELVRLKAQLGIEECQVFSPYKNFTLIPKLENYGFVLESEPEPESEHEPKSGINKMSDSIDKIRLFMSLFRGRDDVYAKRWENRKKGTAGYLPVCANEWKQGICQKGKIKCADCKYKSYRVLDETVIDDHLRSRNDFVAGIYPMCLDETCYFLAIDFDDGEWQKDVTISTKHKQCG